MNLPSFAMAQGGLCTGDLLHLADSVLEIDLSAIVHNWEKLSRMGQGTECAAVLSYDAWGLGLEAVGAALANVGCRTFFVASPLEGMALREVCPDAVIHVLHGLQAETAEVFENYSLRPVINSCDELAVWVAHARRRGILLPAALRVDTGGDQLGLTMEEARQIAARDNWRGHVRITLVSSRLLHGDEVEHPLNRVQKQRFDSLGEAFPEASTSLVDTLPLLGLPEWGYDVFRAGLLLFAPPPAARRAMVDARRALLRQAVALKARILQVRTLDIGERAGNQQWVARRPSRIAVLGIGANEGLGKLDRRRPDGVPHVFIGGQPAPMVGYSVSGHLCVDVTDIDADVLARTRQVEIFGAQLPLERIAGWLGESPSQLLCTLGGRLPRCYRREEG